MRLNNGSAQLRERIGFYRHGTSSDGAGGSQTAPILQFETWAAFHHLRGGEAVMAGRLSGTHSVIVRVRRSQQTLAVGSEWSIEDRRSGKRYNIRDVEPVGLLWLDFTCQSGVAT